MFRFIGQYLMVKMKNKQNMKNITKSKHIEKSLCHLYLLMHSLYF